jgi:hypothetical protein
MVFADELPPLPRSRLSIWFWRLFKVGVVVAGLFLFGIAILTRIGGNDDNLRRGLEQLIGRTAGGYPVHVGQLQGMSFFPYVRVFAENIVIMQPPLPEAAPAEGEASADDQAEEIIDERPPLMTVGRLMFSRSFWDAFLWQGRVEGVRVEGVSSLPGFLLPRAVSDGFIALGPDLFDGKAGAEISGKYGTHDFMMKFALDFEKINLRPTYRLPKESAFSFAAGPLSAHGKMMRGKGGGLRFDFDALTLESPGVAKAVVPLQGSLEVRNGFTTHNFYLTLRNENNELYITRQSPKDGGEIEMGITARQLVLGDVAGLLHFAEQVAGIYSDDADGVSYAVDMTVEELAGDPPPQALECLKKRLGVEGDDINGKGTLVLRDKEFAAAEPSCGAYLWESGK